MSYFSFVCAICIYYKFLFLFFLKNAGISKSFCDVLTSALDGIEFIFFSHVFDTMLSTPILDIGSFFSKEDEPQERSADVRAIKFGDGTVIKHDRKSGSLTVNAIGDISIIAAGTLTIRGAAVNIN